MSKTVLITGASAGFGKDFAEIFAKKGFDVILVARREKNLKSLCLKIEKDFHDGWRGLTSYQSTVPEGKTYLIFPDHKSKEDRKSSKEKIEKRQ